MSTRTINILNFRRTTSSIILYPLQSQRLVIIDRRNSRTANRASQDETWSMIALLAWRGDRDDGTTREIRACKYRCGFNGDSQDFSRDIEAMRFLVRYKENVDDVNGDANGGPRCRHAHNLTPKRPTDSTLSVVTRILEVRTLFLKIRRWHIYVTRDARH